MHKESAVSTQKWSDLSQRTRGLVITAAAADVILRVAALIDIRRRPASRIRGHKWIWATAVAIVNSAGILPVSYFALGRRRPGAGQAGAAGQD
jgi:hypothetical protein